MEEENKELEYNSFEEYPHNVFATAFLVNGEMADYKIGNRESRWGTRTFRGSDWENEAFENYDDWNLTCEYKKILVKNSDEHNKAFHKLEDWVFENYTIYKKSKLSRW